MQLKLRDIFTRIRNLPNEVKMCRKCTSNVSCSSVELVSCAPGGEFRMKSYHRLNTWIILNACIVGIILLKCIAQVKAGFVLRSNSYSLLLQATLLKLQD